MKKTYIFLLLFSILGFSQSDSVVVYSDYELEDDMYYYETDTVNSAKENLIFYSKKNQMSEVVPKTFSPNFQEKYKNKEFQYKTVEETKNQTAWSRFWRSVIRFLARIFDFSGTGKAVSGFGIFMKIVAFAVIGFIIYAIVKIIINKEGTWIFGKNKKKITVSERVAENIHTIDFNAIVKQSKQDKDYRLTIRYYYLWLLKSLSDKEIIEWDIEKTNSDYLYEIKAPILKENFKYLSYIYDYSWYGEFDLTEKDFAKAETAFLKAITNK